MAVCFDPRETCRYIVDWRREDQGDRGYIVEGRQSANMDRVR